jgi:ABC-type glycerol-3-phosphate transport system substrate-binding protein
MYMQLLYAAPEIADSWDIALFPGIYDEERGEVLRYTSGAAETLVIFDSSNRQDDAWRYIEWWLNTDTQVNYANNLQASYGREFMWAPANTQAFRQLPWQSEHREVIVEMQQWIREPPRVPGIYMTERELSNAFNRIVLDGWRLRSTLYDSIIIINREMERRMEEFGYMQDGHIIREYQIPSLALVREWIGAQ